jgi:hypothetical protein
MAETQNLSRYFKAIPAYFRNTNMRKHIWILEGTFSGGKAHQLAALSEILVFGVLSRQKTFSGFISIKSF